MSFLLHKKQTLIIVTDTNISAQEISHTDGKIISEHSIPLASGIIVRGAILDENRFSEALQSLQTASGHGIGSAILRIPDEQCFPSVCSVPAGLSKENIRSSLIAHAKTIIPIQYDGMYIGYAAPKMIANTNTQSFEYIAIEGNVFDVYQRVFEKNKIDLEGIQGISIVPGSILSIPVSQFGKDGIMGTPLKKEETVNLSVPGNPENAIQKKRIATYIFLGIAFIVLGYIIYTYIIVPFL